MLDVALPDVEATEALGAALAHEVQRGDVIFLRGELGSGKTSLARGFLRTFFGNRNLDVPSPSYLLHFAYCCSAADPAAAVAKPLPASAAAGGGVGESNKAPDGAAVPLRASTTSLLPGCPVHHVDPYRLPEGRIAGLIDFEAAFADIALVEWPERLGPQLVTAEKPVRLEVNFKGYGPQAEGREVVISAVGQRWQPTLDRWATQGGPLRYAPSDPLPEPEEGSGSGDSLVLPPTLSLSAGPPSAGAETTRNCKPQPADPGAWRVLGVESSCDDTGAAVLDGNGLVLGEALASQAHIHEKWGGVVPRLAQEAHREAIDATVEEALHRAGVNPAELTAVAVTVGPGLGLCLEVGVRKALSIAAMHRLPLVRIHHMEAHTLVTRLPPAATLARPAEGAEPAQTAASTAETSLHPAFPFVTLLVSGGHNMSVLSRSVGHHTILGSSMDDSIGEAFDKTARCLGITQVPGGPHLERLAKEGDAAAHRLTRPLSKTRDPVLRSNCDYSFSGLKTSVKTLVEKELSSHLSEAELQQKRANIAAVFQSTAVDHLCERAARAVEWALEKEPKVSALVVAGGVAANQQVRSGLREIARAASLEMCCPPPRLCVDNGVMVAWAGVERLRLGLHEEPPSEAGVERAVEVLPRWPLGDRDPRSYYPKQPKSAQKRKKMQAEEAAEGGGPPGKAPKVVSASAAAGGELQAAVAVGLGVEQRSGQEVKSAAFEAAP